MNVAQQMKLLELIEAYANAQVELSWVGAAGDPADKPALEADAKDAAKELEDYIQELTE